MMLPKPEKRGRKAKKRIPKVGKMPRQKAMKKALELWSRIIRNRDVYCQANGRFCNCGGGLQAAHLFGRKAYPWLKLDIDNGVGLCAGHHIFLDHHVVEMEEFSRGFLGDEHYEVLRGRTQRGGPIKLDPFAFLAEHGEAATR